MMNPAFDQRRILASLTACANIPIEALENEKCLIERLMDAIGNGGAPYMGLKRKELVEAAKQEREDQPLLTPEIVQQVETLERTVQEQATLITLLEGQIEDEKSKALASFNQYQTMVEEAGRLRHQVLTLQTDLARAKKK